MMANATVTCKNASSLYHFRKRFPFCFFIFILFFTPLPLVSKMNPQAHSSLRILPPLSRLLGCNDGWTTTRLWVVMVTWLFKTGWSLIMVGLGSLFLSHGVVLDFYFIFLSCWFCFGFVAVVDYYYYYFLFRWLTWFFFFFLGGEQWPQVWFAICDARFCNSGGWAVANLVCGADLRWLVMLGWCL